MLRIFEKKLIEEFKDRKSFSRDELFDFFRGFEPNLKEGTFGCRIYTLKQNNIIKPLKRGVYAISYKSTYEPTISPELDKLSKKISNRYEDIKYCLWSTDWLNTFSQHQSNTRILIFDVEKDFVESVYYYLKDNFNYDIFLNPDANAINYYISESKSPVVVKRLITRSPVEEITIRKDKIFVPMLEKILVDVFADSKLFYFYQGSELRHIFENAVKYYAINFTSLFSYARRRGKEKEIKSYMMNNLSDLLKEIIND
ncbi:MAG: hypothetical protein HQ562_03815 [Candidatus Marinimicrobia bacterium]|nr:hypothetical protein [Candidatus Neomarinimicrobiota bacterium]